MIRLAVDESAASPHPIALAELLALPDVRGGRETPTGYELRAGSVQAVLPSLLALGESRAVRWHELSTHSATLEDVFVSLTGRELRDG